MLIAANLLSYICLVFLANRYLYYNLFHQSIRFTSSSLLLLPLASCLLVLIVMFTSLFLDTKGEPLYDIFKTTANFDFYIRLFVDILTIFLVKDLIDTNNARYLYVLIGLFFCINFYLESRMLQAINNISDTEIEHIQKINFIKLDDEQVFKYRSVLKDAKKAFWLMILIIPFKFLLENIFLLSILFIIYSVLILFLLKEMYFTLYERDVAIKKILIKYLILLCGFILVLLLNERIIDLKFYNFTPEELISLIVFSTLPLYLPVRNIYLSLKRSHNLQ